LKTRKNKNAKNLPFLASLLPNLAWFRFLAENGSGFCILGQKVELLSLNK